jgi:Na+/melibiose symporter-like transporter
LVHNFTGFLPGYATYEELAAVVTNMELVFWGIRFLSGVIPALILLIRTLIFWKFYPLTQDVVIKNKAELDKLGF